MRVFEKVHRRVDERMGNLAFFQTREDLVARKFADDFFDPAIDQCEFLRPAQIGAQRRVGPEVIHVKLLAEPFPVGVAGDADEYLALVLREENLIYGPAHVFPFGSFGDRRRTFPRYTGVAMYWLTKKTTVSKSPAWMCWPRPVSFLL